MLGLFKFWWQRKRSEHKEDEEKVRAQQQLLRTVVDNLPFWICLENAQHDFQLFNRQLLEVLGVSESDIEKLDMHELQERFGADLPEISAAEQDVLNSGKKLEREIEMDGPNGKQTLKMVKLPLFQANGELQGLLTYAEDITKRHLAEKRLQESEARYRDLFEATFEGLVVISERRLIAANQAFGQMMGCPLDQLLGLKLSQFLFSEGYGGSGENLNIDLSGMKDKHYQGCLRRKDGSLIPVEVLTRFQEYDGGPVSVMALRDISERKRMEQMVRHFVSMVSHELRTPLTSIAGSLGLLVEVSNSNFDDGSQKLLRIARQNCERLIRLTNDILDVSRLENGRMLFQKSTIDIKALVERAIEEMRAYGVSFKVNFKLYCSGKKPCLIHADADRILQVLTNLISNATKFSPSGETVDIYLKPSSEYVSVRVCDRGPGIPAESSNKVFMPFFQIENGKHGGSGLGLSIAKQIIEHSGGGIHFQPRTGGGAVFYFHLPLISECGTLNKIAKNKSDKISPVSLPKISPQVNIIQLKN